MKKKSKKSGTRVVHRNKLEQLFRLNSWSKDHKNNILLAYESQIEELMSYYHKFPDQLKVELVKKLERLIFYDEIREEKIRIGVVRLLIALFPQSFPLIKKTLFTMRNIYDYELHFTIFCYLDDALSVNNNSLVEELTILITDYLLKIKVRTARAYWMAGHLLGDHWPCEKSYDALLRLAKNAKHRIARESIIYALEDLYCRVNSIQKLQIKSQIKKMKKSDRSGSVRSLASLVLKEIVN